MMKLNKDKWENRPFSFVAECIEKHDKNPFLNGITKFVGLENLDGINLKIIGYGNIENGTTFTKTFNLGDALFGKRRPYLKKVAVADFKGICSGDILVFRPKKDKILPTLLPLYVSSDGFIQYAISTSAGSLSPRTKWRDLATYEISLPPISEQHHIVSIFESIETAIEQMEIQEKNLLNLKNQLLQELFNDKLQFGNYLSEKDFEKIKFDKIAINISERVEPKKTELTTYVGLEHLDADNLKIERRGTPDDVIGTKLKIYKGDIIFGKRRAYLRKVAVSDFNGIASAHSMILRANETNIEKNFLPYFMQSDTFMNRAVEISEGSLSPTIKWKTLAQQEFILPKKERQKKLADIFKQFDKTREQLKYQKTTLKTLKQKLLNEVLG